MKIFFSYLQNKSEVTRIVLALFVGVLVKAFAVLIIMAVYFLRRAYYQSNLALESPASTFMRIENGQHIWTYTLGDFINALIIAPIGENLAILLIFWLCSKISKAAIFPIVIITIVAYFAHFGGSFGVNGAAGFFVLSVYYALLKRSTTTWRAYYYTVIAHFSANLISLIASLI